VCKYLIRKIREVGVPGYVGVLLLTVSTTLPMLDGLDIFRCDISKWIHS
jgi:hypothetical protein